MAEAAAAAGRVPGPNDLHVAFPGNDRGGQAGPARPVGRDALGRSLEATSIGPRPTGGRGSTRRSLAAAERRSNGRQRRYRGPVGRLSRTGSARVSPAEHPA